MKELFLNFFKRFVLFAVALFFFQFIVVDYIYDLELFYSTAAVYGFHFAATLLVYFALLFVYANFPDKTGFAFIGFGLFKMFASVLFLVPMLLNESLNPFQDILAFFVPYFLFLAFETVSAVKLLN